MRKNKLLFILLMAVVVGGIAIGSLGAEEKASLKVEILIFSGRPNPVYYIDDPAVISKLKEMYGQKESVRQVKPTVLPSKLGYTGVIIYNEQNISGLPETMIVSKTEMESIVTTTTSRSMTRGKVFSKDSSEGIESFILDQAFRSSSLDEEIKGILKEAIAE